MNRSRWVDVATYFFNLIPKTQKVTAFWKSLKRFKFGGVALRGGKSGHRSLITERCWIICGTSLRLYQPQRLRKWTDLEEYMHLDIFIFIQLQIEPNLSTFENIYRYISPALTDLYIFKKKPLYIYNDFFQMYILLWQEPMIVILRYLFDYWTVLNVFRCISKLLRLRFECF